MVVQPQAEARPRDISDVLAIGFGATVAMWAVGYVGHLPLVDVPPIVFVSLMLACLVLGGAAAGRYGRRGVRGGLWVGGVSALVNLLILGSVLIKPNSGQLVPGAWLWLPGWFALSLMLGGGGAAVGGLLRGALENRAPSAAKIGTVSGEVPWIAIFGWITCAAAMLLILAGGLVTGFRAGMAVPDWPNTYGTNMFLYPLSKMTGGVFYEHTHRLLGTLVGSATFTMAVYLTRMMGGRRGLIRLIWIVGTCVVLQGIAGGFRVRDDSHCLAVFHGFFAHAVLAGLVTVAVVLSRDRRGGVFQPSEEDAWQTGGIMVEGDRLLTALLVGVVLLQTLLGTLVRQIDVSLLTHVAMAAVVALVTLGTGMRAWGLNPDEPVLRRCGIGIMVLVLLQVTLGIVSIALRTPPVGTSPGADVLEMAGNWLPIRPLPALLTTAHQSTAALILAVAVVLAVWTWHPTPRSPAPRAALR